MKKSRFFIALLVMFVAASGFAQDSYREALKEYISLNGQADRTKTSFMTLTESFFKKTDGVDLNALTERYIKECLDEQVADMMIPIMKERNVTEADLREVISLLSTPQGKAFTEHQNEWNIELPAALIGAMVEQASMFEDGAAVENVAVNPEIDADYAAKFRNMMEVGKVKDMFMGFWDGFKEGAPNMPETFKNWFEENFITITMNSAFGIMTPEDIEYGTKLFSNELFGNHFLRNIDRLCFFKGFHHLGQNRGVKDFTQIKFDPFL